VVSRAPFSSAPSLRGVSFTVFVMWSSSRRRARGATGQSTL